MDPAKAFGNWLRNLNREFHGDPLLLSRESAAILAVSVLDLLMTYVLLRQGFHFYESNPVARWFFLRWNMAGMVAFKFLLISLAIVFCEIVERRRPGLGRKVLGFGTVAASAVVAYSLLLFYRHVLSVPG
ncbi:hypothetical protein SAMN05444166_1560 [Singulisphaera sp. GP187]|uniref:DUF5658 family protein n=1 Tax=Singulisphaera sp. GP187 TaxID=1882752 RepID=UPI000929A608|nr:DUF5658 family protein [Singulisphaera sp. GP187]SIN90832.1 hypothetical protein SAMN05444166_1560 [Singulisphaera sp. GP187]